MALKGFTQTYGELLFAQNGAGNALLGNASAGTATLLSKQSSTYPLPSLDAGYFSPHYGVNKAIKVIARGVISSVASNTQTLTAGLYFASSDTTTIGTALCATGAFTPASSLSSAVWELECDINCTAAGTSGTMQGLGMLTVSPTTAAGVTIGAGGSATVTYNTENAAFLQIGATWGASGSSGTNSITCYQVLVFALN
jgi:hypothetical protein